MDEKTKNMLRFLWDDYRVKNAIMSLPDMFDDIGFAFACLGVMLIAITLYYIVKTIKELNL